MAEWKVIARDCSLEIAFGGQAHGGAVPVYPAATSYKGRARTLSIRETLASVDVHAWADLREKHRPTIARTEIRIEGFVANTGFSFYDTATY